MLVILVNHYTLGIVKHTLHEPVTTKRHIVQEILYYNNVTTSIKTVLLYFMHVTRFHAKVVPADYVRERRETKHVVRVTNGPW